MELESVSNSENNQLGLVKSDSEKRQDYLKSLRLENKSVVSISGIDEVGKTTIIRQLVTKFPDQIGMFVFPTSSLRDQIFNLGNIKIDDYKNFYDVYNYNMAFRKDLIDNMNKMLSFLSNKKILLLDRSVIDHIVYFNYDLIKFAQERSRLLTNDSMLLDHRYFVNYLDEIKKVQNQYLVPNNLPDHIVEFLNFISSCIYIFLPKEKITNKDKKYNKDDLFIVQKIFDQVLDELYNNQNTKLKKLRYYAVEGLLNDPDPHCTYNEVKEYLVDYHDLIE